MSHSLWPTFSLAYIILGIHYIWPTFSLAYIILGHTFHWAYIILGIYYIWPTFLLASLSISSPSFSLSSPKFLVPTLCYVIQFFEFSHLWSWEDFLQTQSVNKRTLSKTNYDFILCHHHLNGTRNFLWLTLTNFQKPVTCFSSFWVKTKLQVLPHPLLLYR